MPFERGKARLSPDATRKRTKIHTYHDEQGRKVFERVRWYDSEGKKQVAYRHSVGKGWALGLDHEPIPFKEKPEGADRYLYRLPRLLEELEKGPDGEVWWTEGESDADALWNEHEICATSHHQGAGNASPEQAEWFRGFDGRVLLCGDADPDTPEGGNVGARCVIKRLDLLTALGIQAKVLMPRSGKDVRDHLESGLGLDDLVRIEGEALAELREKADRTTVGSLRAYLDSPETVALGEALGENGRGWKVKVKAAEPEWVQERREAEASDPKLRVLAKLRSKGWNVRG
ncbi:toprim domain-containing protein [Micromonospora sp. WMMD956]|uniref:toprim domain-containing protein n=1 Tax=Micromonospora sp. WMMD956 TaxID=3016108 RepID=UPI0024169E8A|nr:toprim domain-containing protein [Micromonospora sp. WMMD956]MDG4816079.1 toprim domain-containing protein [Micromonospora sp. WMMD956]